MIHKLSVFHKLSMFYNCIYKNTFYSLLLLACVVQQLVQNQAWADSLYPGGNASVVTYGPNSYSLPSANMSMTRRLDFSVGNSFFRNPWVSSPASTTARDGLGPLFNAYTCQACHIKDGRGHTPENDDDIAVSLLVRLSIEPENPDDQHRARKYGPLPHPVYGGQIQDFAIHSLKPEAQISLSWTNKVVLLAGGEKVNLRQPVLRLDEPQYGDFGQSAKTSIRVAPPMIGLGLLEAIPEELILAQEDIYDRDGDGISGKANRVWSVINKQAELGRFGWKAGQPSLAQQNAAAFNGDLGITSSLFPKDDCQPSQVACLNAPDGGLLEVSDRILGFIEFYTRNLAVPARDENAHLKYEFGRRLFEELDCSVCHTPKFQTASIEDQPEQSNQEIWPYTDLLLHDMGEELADNRNEFLADGREWRTPPLWGLSKLKEVNGHTELLHDGRAKNVQEAILWHGGEASFSRMKYTKLPKNEREALLRFVESL